MDPNHADDKLAKAAEQALYKGSPEHKNHPSFAGPAGLRKRLNDEATPCDPVFADKQEMLTEWIKQAIASGQVSSYWEGDFPRYAWLKVGDDVYEARLMNQGLGEYKGYALKPNQYPKELS